MTTEESFKKFDALLKIRDAKSPMEAAAFQALLQEGSTRELIKGVNELGSGVKDLLGSSTRLEKVTKDLVCPTRVLAALTLVLVILTGVLVWFTAKLG